MVCWLVERVAQVSGSVIERRKKTIRLFGSILNGYLRGRLSTLNLYKISELSPDTTLSLITFDWVNTLSTDRGYLEVLFNMVLMWRWLKTTWSFLSSGVYLYRDIKKLKWKIDAFLKMCWMWHHKNKIR